MALPWLIGAAVLGIGAYLSSSSSAENSSNGNGDDEERRRRERVERERREREQEEERNSIREAFKKEGEQRTADFQQILSGWVNVHYESQPSFKVTIFQKTGKLYKRVVPENFTDSHELYLLDKITRENLDEFEACYDVDLTMTETFYDTIDEIMDCQEQLRVLQDYRNQFELIREQLHR